MSNVRERVSIEAPYGQAVQSVERRLGFTGAQGDGRTLLTLVAPAPDGREIARDVEVTSQHVAADANFTARYRIAWDAARTSLGIPTPGFAGTLTVRAGEDYGECELELEGRYDPPGGPAGLLFDGIIGRRIAHATLGALLDGVGRMLRENYVRTEAGKHRPAPLV